MLLQRRNVCFAGSRELIYVFNASKILNNSRTGEILEAFIINSLNRRIFFYLTTSSYISLLTCLKRAANLEYFQLISSAYFRNPLLQQLTSCFSSCASYPIHCFFSHFNVGCTYPVWLNTALRVSSLVIILHKLYFS